MSSSARDTRAGFALLIHGFSLMALLAAATAPTPLYHLYQQTWHFATPWLTAVFAIYAVTLLLALLFGARLSDHLGRRPTIALALLLDMLAMGLFAVATSTVWLLWARAIQGFATGLAMAALGAAMLDLDRQRGAVINSVAPMFGMSLGALGSTALSIRLSSPLHGVYFVLIGVLAFALGLTSVTSETSPRRPVTWASLRPSVGVPVAIRRAFWAVTPINIAVWMLGGFYLSLMPSLVMLATHAGTPWLAGGVVAMLTLTGALGIILALRQPALQVLLGGAGLLLAGTCLIRHGADLASAHEMVAGSLLAGLGFGSAFLGAVRNVLPRAEPHQRSQLMGVFYLESYLAFSLPAMLLGFVAQRQGLLPAMHLYTDAIIVLLVGAIAWIVGQRAHLHSLAVS